MLFFSRWPGTAIAHTSKFVGIQLKKNIWETSMYPQHAFRPRRSLFWRVLAYLETTKAAISRYTSNIVHNLVWDSDFRVRKCQYPSHKNQRYKVETEVNLPMAEKSKACGESSWWQGDCRPNRMRTVTAILESAMNKEEGQEERLSEHQFS